MNLKERVGSAVEATAEKSSQFEQWFRESWRTVAFMALLLVLVSVGLLYYALSGTGSSANAEPAFRIADTTTTGPMDERALDGVLVDASSTHLLPLGVMVENNIEAWPLSGPAKANVIYEAPVEGSITRLLLFFDASSTVDRIGPVRSARPYYVQIADGLGALYAHVGGSPAALSLIQSLKGFQDLNEFSNGPYFKRDPGRPSPHNVYTSTELLLKAAEQKEYAVKEFRPWQYVDDATSTEAEPDTVEIPVPYDGVYKAVWKYAPDTHLYTREQNGMVQKDQDGTVVTARNVVILLTTARVLDNEGRLDLRTTGTGDALIFRDGQAFKATWKRLDGQMMTFETVDGLDVPLARGATWVSFLTSKLAFARVMAATQP